jgi:hypothetical protein
MVAIAFVPDRASVKWENLGSAALPLRQGGHAVTHTCNALTTAKPEGVKRSGLMVWTVGN